MLLQMQIDRSLRILAAVLVVCAALGAWWWLRCGPATTLLIVRHADRPTDGSDALTPAGMQRAQDLVRVAQKAGVLAVYRTNTNRSRDTAQPLATALGLTPVIYDMKDVRGVVAAIFAEHRGETVFVVAHSDTTPQIIAEAGGPVLPEIARDEFDDLSVLTACSCRRGKATLVDLQYGAPTP
jgi:broad specificity phosphatase PhoE